MRVIKDKAIIIESSNIQRADKLIIFYTMNHGLVKGVAEAARRMKSKYGSCFEPLTSVEISYLQKEDRELVTIQEAVVISSVSQYGKKPEYYFFIFYSTELMKEFAVAGKNIRFYKLLEAIQAGIKRDVALSLLARWTEIQFLHEHGIIADWKNCAVCKKEIMNGNEVRFFSPEGVFKCNDCYQIKDIQVKQEAFLLMNKLLYVKIEQLETLAVNDRLLKRIGSILKVTIQHHVEKPLRFYEFYRQINNDNR
ncbi:MAG: DNA repair protein RecO [Candidatus Fischerbacteria bacterium RBG_13_37_8]|uniref:DNA repair protein RecO n=1 Tax=Candidatus Fischerbacteria bacterium RBG_13_37_8 TaxID=1817863 RepID=A0A1F5VEF6_9BACT|nr:MAG: DNA repair protein RecO [Candidatus Fischerbacteria bacterium RBG_13_37_8]